MFFGLRIAIVALRDPIGLSHSRFQRDSRLKLTWMLFHLDRSGKRYNAIFNGYGAEFCVLQIKHDFTRSFLFADTALPDVLAQM